MKTFWNLVDQSYDTEAEAIAVQESLLNSGYPLCECLIEQYWVDAGGNISSDKPKDYRGVELLAEQRNALIDFCG